MADEFQIGVLKDSLDVLGQVFQQTSTYSDVTDIIRLSGAIASSISVFGAILGVIGKFAQDQNDEILQGLEQLSHKIDLVRGDIHQMEKDIVWRITEASYKQSVHNILVGIDFINKMGTASLNINRMMYLEKLSHHCQDEKCTSALIFILNEVNEEGLLEKFYDKTGGDRPKISAFGTRLLRLLYQGLLVVSTYDTTMYGKERAKAVIENYSDRLDTAGRKINSILDRCKINFSSNMLNDLNKQLDEGGSNQDLVTKISKFISKKYDWLENLVLVYNDIWGFDKHCIQGHYVESFHRNGKCGVIFYRYKDEKPRLPDRYSDAHRVIFSNNMLVERGFLRCPIAGDTFNNIEAALAEKGIEWRGLAVISTSRLHVCGTTDFKYKNAFSTRIIHAHLQRQDRWVSGGYKGAETILLLD